MRIYIGWDSREQEAYDVCVKSIRRFTPNVEIIPLKKQELEAAGVYDKPNDPLASTEFTYTRFLTPHLARLVRYRGWAMFVDCDFLFTSDISELFALTDDRYAAMCVKHADYSTGGFKMDGKVQTSYPRKNWSSLILFNCDHPGTKVLTPDFVNRSYGSVLHRFSWLKDELLGELPPTWNWLEGTHEKPKEGPPKAIHFTRGTPIFEGYHNVDYAELWITEYESLTGRQFVPPTGSSCRH